MTAKRCRGPVGSHQSRSEWSETPAPVTRSTEQAGQSAKDATRSSRSQERSNADTIGATPSAGVERRRRMPGVRGRTGERRFARSIDEIRDRTLDCRYARDPPQGSDRRFAPRAARRRIEDDQRPRRLFRFRQDVCLHQRPRNRNSPSRRSSDGAPVLEGRRRFLSARRRGQHEGMDTDRPCRCGRLREGSSALPAVARIRQDGPGALASEGLIERPVRFHPGPHAPAGAGPAPARRDGRIAGNGDAAPSCLPARAAGVPSAGTSIARGIPGLWPARGAGARPPVRRDGDGSGSPSRAFAAALRLPRCARRPRSDIRLRDARLPVTRARNAPHARRRTSRLPGGSNGARRHSAGIRPSAGMPKPQLR